MNRNTKPVQRNVITIVEVLFAWSVFVRQRKIKLNGQLSLDCYRWYMATRDKFFLAFSVIFAFSWDFFYLYINNVFFGNTLFLRLGCGLLKRESYQGFKILN